MPKRDAVTVQTAADLMATRIPTATAKTTVKEAVEHLAKGRWEDIHAVYVIDKQHRLLGLVPTAKLLSAARHRTLADIMQSAKATVGPTTERDQMVNEIIRDDIAVITVIDESGRLLGIVSDDRVVDILHQEHLEDLLRSSGIGSPMSGFAGVINRSILGLVRLRIPWLAFGLGIGLIGSLITSSFELSLRQNIALVFFLPIMTYLSDAVGTQSEAIFLRATTLFKVNVSRYILREAIVGVLMGAILGIIAGLFGYFISGSWGIAFVVSISLLLSMTSATILACLTPLVLTLTKADEAVGSGPFATALQDLVSITIYLLVAAAVL